MASYETTDTAHAGAMAGGHAAGHGAAHGAGHGPKHPYHLVDPSPWPIVGALSAGLLAAGALVFMHGGSTLLLVLGLAAVVMIMVVWWRDVLKEALVGGHHTPVVRLGLRYGMALFIASEVMFFAAWFWAYFDFSLFPREAIGHVWPPKNIQTFDAFEIPWLNTVILLLSGTTVTWAHHALIENNRHDLLRALGLTIILGILFSFFQAYEYSHAAFGFREGVYPSVFYMATGFHGFHVIVGTIFLGVCWMRAKRGEFTPERHFGFEAAAWYWHFVDVVWLFLFVCVYVLGAGASGHG